MLLALSCVGMIVSMLIICISLMVWIMTSYYYGLIESKIYLLETEIKEKTEELKRLKDLKNHYDEMNEYNE